MIQLSEKTKRRKKNERAFKKLRAKQAKISGRKPARDAKYLAWIRRLPCIVPTCTAKFFPNMGISKMEAAHVGERGLAQKCSDRETVPLCVYCHRSGRLSHHQLGKQFWRAHNLDREAIIKELNELYELLKKGAA